MESGKYTATVAAVRQFLTIFQTSENENLQPNYKSRFLQFLKTLYHGLRMGRDFECGFLLCFFVFKNFS